MLPHERTTPKASTDRLDLTRATRANLSPVWGLSLASGLTGLLAEPGEPVGRVVDDDRSAGSGGRRARRRAGGRSRPDRRDPAGAGRRRRAHRRRPPSLQHQPHLPRRRTHARPVAATDPPSRRSPSSASWSPSSSASRRSIGSTPTSTLDDLAEALGRSLRPDGRSTGPTPRPWRRWRPRASWCWSDRTRPGGSTRSPAGSTGVRALDGAWLETALADVPVTVTYQHGLAEALAEVDAGRAIGGGADPPGQRGRDRADRARGPADAAQVDLLHPEAQDGIRDPPAGLTCRLRAVSARERGKPPPVWTRSRCSSATAGRTPSTSPDGWATGSAPGSPSSWTSTTSRLGVDFTDGPATGGRRLRRACWCSSVTRFLASGVRWRASAGQPTGLGRRGGQYRPGPRTSW